MVTTHGTEIVIPTTWYAHTNSEGQPEIWDGSTPRHEVVAGEVECRNPGLRALWNALPRMQWGVLGERSGCGYGISRTASEAQAHLVAWLRTRRRQEAEVVQSLDGNAWTGEFGYPVSAPVLPGLDDLIATCPEATLRNAHTWAAEDPYAADHLAALIREAQTKKRSQ